MPGPLPNPTRRRRNTPTIPTTNLRLSGPTGPAPAVPSWIKLGKSGRAWWRWAWTQPQACGWGTGAGFEVMVARRASLEDDDVALSAVTGATELGAVLGAANDEAIDDLMLLIGELKRLAGNRLSVLREMRELDDRLGLTPKGMAALRWTIVDDPAPVDAEATAPKEDEVGRRRQERRERMASA